MYKAANSRKNDAANYSIAFMSVALNLYLSVGSTLYVFWIPFKRDQAIRYREETHVAANIHLELVTREKQPSLD